MLTVSASEARANFSKLGEEVSRTKQPITVFKNSKPWLVIAPAQDKQEKEISVDLDAARKLTLEEKTLLSATNEFVEEYRDVFEVLAQ
ncbi:MAG: type II toxin-antitoxin system Phd/YefM family antitoxin [Coriobacteriia bacterium]|jgi:prevent-host-death family protein|nr:type II toxin-antitoxin system Phd/YefM family antitoxin [Coriobacteriia bacterium]MDR2714851.1 type II toxin-antitoxin system Phd/YefM family antitoxin [Coriobacteriales bacterium]